MRLNNLPRYLPKLLYDLVCLLDSLEIGDSTKIEAHSFYIDSFNLEYFLLGTSVKFPYVDSNFKFSHIYTDGEHDNIRFILHFLDRRTKVRSKNQYLNFVNRVSFINNFMDSARISNSSTIFEISPEFEFNIINSGILYSTLDSNNFQFLCCWVIDLKYINYLLDLRAGFIDFLSIKYSDSHWSNLKYAISNLGSHRLKGNFDTYLSTLSHDSLHVFTLRPKLLFNSSCLRKVSKIFTLLHKRILDKCISNKIDVVHTDLDSCFKPFISLTDSLNTFEDMNEFEAKIISSVYL